MSEQRLIDANALPVYQRTIRYNTGEYVQEYVLAYDVRSAPTIEAVEVVHGHWIDRIEIFSESEGPVPALGCSVCGTSQRKYRRTPYCPHCGAKMDGGGSP